MTAIAFDTLKFAKRLKEGGFTDQQAEALAQAEAEFIEQSLAAKRDLKELEVALKRDLKEIEVALKRDLKELEIALKRDIEEIRGGVKRDIEGLRADLKRDMKELEYRMTIKLGALLVVAVGAMATLVKLL
ncbi:MAG: coiled-coil domain-containing protein [Gammaproteobacteria bacterium]